MIDANEIWLAIEGLQESVKEHSDRLVEVEKDSHPPVEWEALIGENMEQTMSCSSKLTKLVNDVLKIKKEIKTIKEQLKRCNQRTFYILADNYFKNKELLTEKGEGRTQETEKRMRLTLKIKEDGKNKK